MTKTGESKRKVLFSLISLLIVAGAAFGLLWASSFLGGRLVTEAIRSGKLTISSRDDVNKYFVFVSKEEAAALLKQEREAGRTVFLFPQVDLNFDGEPITVKEINTETEGKQVTFLVFSGLGIGTKVYSTEEAALIGGVAQKFIWFTERANDQAGFARTTYVSASTALGGFLANLDDAYSFFPAKTEIALLNVSAKFTEPVEAQVAASISDGAKDDYAVFANILRKNGKFVMVK